MSQNTGFCVDMPTASEDIGEPGNQETNTFHQHNVPSKKQDVIVIQLFVNDSDYGRENTTSLPGDISSFWRMV